MISSQDISNSINQSQQSFSGMNQYSAQLSNQMGIGSYGFSLPSQQFGRHAFGPHQKGGFQHGGAWEHSYGPSNTIGGMGVSALAGAGTLGMFGASFIPGIGAALNPFAGGAAAWGAGKAMGMGLGGKIGMGLMGAAPALALGAFGAHGLGSMVHGAQEQASIERAVGGMNFMNAGSRSGKGFSRQDAMQIGNMTRELAHLPEMLTSVSELTRIMDKMSSSGLMQGVRDVATFNTKFKQSLSALKDIARVVGTTMEEALPIFAEARKSGHYSHSDIIKNAVGRQFTSSLTGMNQQQVGSLQSMGAGMSNAMGGTRRTGSNLAARQANHIGMALQMGAMTQEQILELTGMEGPEGIQALAGGLTESAYRLGKSSLGTALALSVGQVKNGRYTGMMDKEMVERVKAGDLTTSEMMAIGKQKSGSHGAKMSFSANRNRLTAEMAGELGPDGIAMMLKNVVGRVSGNPEALKLVLKRYGLDEQMAGQVMDSMERAPMVQARMSAGKDQETKRAAHAAFMQEKFSSTSMMKKIKTRIHNALTAPAEGLGVAIRDSIGNAVDDFVDELTGQYKTELTKGGARLAVSSLAGSDVSANRMTRFNNVKLGRANNSDINNTGSNTSSVMGGLASFARYMAGSRLAGDIREDTLSGFGIKQGEVNVGEAIPKGAIITGRSSNWFGGDKYRFQTEGQESELLDKISKARRTPIASMGLRALRGDKYGFELQKLQGGLLKEIANIEKSGVTSKEEIFNKLNSSYGKEVHHSYNDPGTREEAMASLLESVGAGDIAGGISPLAKNGNVDRGLLADTIKKSSRIASKYKGGGWSDVEGHLKSGSPFSRLLMGNGKGRSGLLQSGLTHSSFTGLMEYARTGNVSKELEKELSKVGGLTKQTLPSRDATKRMLGLASDEAASQSAWNVGVAQSQMDYSISNEQVSAAGTKILDLASGDPFQKDPIKEKRFERLEDSDFGSDLLEDLDEAGGNLEGSTANSKEARLGAKQLSSIAYKLSTAKGKNKKIAAQFRSLVGNASGVGVYEQAQKQTAKILRKTGNIDKLDEAGVFSGLEDSDKKRLQKKYFNEDGNISKKNKAALKLELADLAGGTGLIRAGTNQNSKNASEQEMKDFFSSQTTVLGQVGTVLSNLLGVPQPKGGSEDSGLGPRIDKV